MAFVFTWDATFKSLPADTENASQGAGRIRDLKSAITERMQVDHSWTGTADDGKHLQVTLLARASDPGIAASTGYLYTKLISGIAELFYKDNAGAIPAFQLTNAGMLNPGSLVRKTTIASAASPNIFAIGNGALIDYTGTATAGSFVAAPIAGMSKRLYLAGASGFTASANLIIPGHDSGATVILAAGAVVDVLAITTTQFLLTYSLSGTFTATGTGFTVNPTVTAHYTYSNGHVRLHFPLITGTSNASSFTITGMPGVIVPSADQSPAIAICIDAGAYKSALSIIDTAGTITLLPAAGGTWTSSGEKSLYATTFLYRAV